MKTLSCCSSGGYGWRRASALTSRGASTVIPLFVVFTAARHLFSSVAEVQTYYEEVWELRDVMTLAYFVIGFGVSALRGWEYKIKCLLFAQILAAMNHVIQFMRLDEPAGCLVVKVYTMHMVPFVLGYTGFWILEQQVLWPLWLALHHSEQSLAQIEANRRATLAAMSYVAARKARDKKEAIDTVLRSHAATTGKQGSRPDSAAPRSSAAKSRLTRRATSPLDRH